MVLLKRVSGNADEFGVGVGDAAVAQTAPGAVFKPVRQVAI